MPPEKILVVEDSPEMRSFIAEMALEPAGYAVLTAADGEQGLQLARAESPDLILTDLKLPGLSGLQVLEQLRAEGYEIPVILITGVGSEIVARQALHSGVVDYLVKPIRPEDLLAAVRRGLAAAAARRSAAQIQTELAEANESLLQRLRELETLTSVGHQVTAVLDLDRVLLKVVEAAVSLTGAEEGSLLLLDEQTGELTMRASKNFDEEFARTFRLRSSDSLAGQVVRTGQALRVDPGEPQKIKTQYLVRSLIYVPLRARGRVIGVLGVDHRLRQRVFSVFDEQLLQALGNYAAVAIDNAQLYARTEAERAKLETILEKTEDGVIVADQAGHLILVNSVARQVLGVAQPEVVGRPLVEIISQPEVQDLFQSETRRRAEINLEEGRTFNVDLTLIPGVGRAAVMQDITHLKELDRIKSEFVTTVSHDLRSPLTAILGYVELIGRAGPLTPQQTEFVRRIQYSVHSITSLVSDLLDLGRIEAGFDAQKEATHASLVIQYAVEGLRGHAESKHQTLLVDVPPGLPLVLTNPPRFRQMLANLVDNAIKYTPEGGQVRVAAHFADESIIITVQDSGVGIPVADQPYIFDKFFRASNTREDQTGTGLGLSIVKSIVENHGGRIWVESHVGQGSIFTVVLPRHVEPPAGNAPAHSVGSGA